MEMEPSSREQVGGAQPGYGQPGGAQPGPASPQVRAAVAVWVAAGVEVVLFGLCALLLGVASTMTLPMDQLPDSPALNQLTMAQLQQGLRLSAAVIGVVMCLPGLVLLYLAFLVREGRRGPAVAAGVILCVQAVPLGLYALLSLLASVMTGQIVAVLFQLLIFGGMTALMIWAAVRAFSMRAGAPGAPGARVVRRVSDEEPWNSHLGGRG